MRVVFGVVVALVVACSSEPRVPPTTLPDGGDVSDAVCSHLGALQCREGLDVSCRVVVRRVLETRLTDLRVTCLLGAQTKSAVRACGQACP